MKPVRSALMAAALFSCSNENQLSDQVNVILPNICQMKFYAMQSGTESDLREMKRRIDSDSTQLIHESVIIDNYLYAKGDCGYLQFDVYDGTFIPIRSEFEYDSWPFDFSDIENESE